MKGSNWKIIREDEREGEIQRVGHVQHPLAPKKRKGGRKASEGERERRRKKRKETREGKRGRVSAALASYFYFSPPLCPIFKKLIIKTIRDTLLQ